MSRPKKETPGAAYIDRWGAPVKVHDYLADDDGHLYYVNSHYQAVPDDDEDAPAVPLADLLKERKVRVMTAGERLNYTPSPKMEGTGEKKEIAPVPAADPAKDVVADNAVDVAILLQGVADKALADELRRRGYFVTAAKPALVYL